MKSEKKLDSALMNAAASTEKASTRYDKSARLAKPELSDDVIASISGGAGAPPPPPPPQTTPGS